MILSSTLRSNSVTIQYTSLKRLYVPNESLKISQQYYILRSTPYIAGHSLQGSATPRPTLKDNLSLTLHFCTLRASHPNSQAALKMTIQFCMLWFSYINYPAHLKGQLREKIRLNPKVLQVNSMVHLKGQLREKIRFRPIVLFVNSPVHREG